MCISLGIGYEMNVGAYGKCALTSNETADRVVTDLNVPSILTKMDRVPVCALILLAGKDGSVRFDEIRSDVGIACFSMVLLNITLGLHNQ